MTVDYVKYNEEAQTIYNERSKIISTMADDYNMVIDLLEKCREHKREIENTFYKMVNYSDDIPALERLSDEMLEMELKVIRMEKQQIDLMNRHEEQIC